MTSTVHKKMMGTFYQKSVDSRPKCEQSSKPVMVTTLIDCPSQPLDTNVSETIDQMLTMIISHKWNDSVGLFFCLFVIVISSKFSTSTFCSFDICHHLLFSKLYIIWGQEWYWHIMYLNKHPISRKEKEL